MFDQLFSSDALLHWVPIVGYPGLCVIILLEMGLIVGCCLPGDSLLFTVGLLASRGVFNIAIVVPLLIVTAIMGYVISYAIGKYLGGWLSKRPDAWYFKAEYLTRTDAFYARYGAHSLFIGRFIPIIRSFIPVTAGMVRMPYGRYTVCNIGGALVWVGSVCGLGYFLGSQVPSIDRYLMPIIAAIIVVSVLPVALRWLHARRQR